MILWKAAVVAFFLELTALFIVSQGQNWTLHSQKAADDTSKFIEAEIYQAPKVARLVDTEKTVPGPSKHESTLSKVPNQGRAAKPGENKLTEENQTQSGVKLATSHGPIAIFSPSPVIPAYLQEQDLHASVVIDFFVTANGSATPRLVGSSGNEELDALAIATAKKWQFHPAEKDQQAIDAKVRLRIIFEVK